MRDTDSPSNNNNQIYSFARTRHCAAERRRSHRRRTTVSSTGRWILLPFSFLLTQSRHVVRSFSSSTYSNRGAEHVVERQLEYLQQKRKVKEAYECFDWEGQQDLGGWELFEQELSKDPDFEPLFTHAKAAVLMVTRQPDPTYCRCLVRLVMPTTKSTRQEEAEKYYNSNLDTIPLLYWWGMRLEERIETAKGVFLKQNPGEGAEWKVQGIQPDASSMELEEILMDEEGNAIDTEDVIYLDEDGNELSLRDEDGNRLSLKDWLEITEEDEDEDEDF